MTIGWICWHYHKFGRKLTVWIFRYLIAFSSIFFLLIKILDRFSFFTSFLEIVSTTPSHPKFKYIYISEENPFRIENHFDGHFWTLVSKSFIEFLKSYNKRKTLKKINERLQSAEIRRDLHWSKMALKNGRALTNRKLLELFNCALWLQYACAHVWVHSYLYLCVCVFMCPSLCRIVLRGKPKKLVWWSLMYTTHIIGYAPIRYNISTNLENSYANFRPQEICIHFSLVIFLYEVRWTERKTNIYRKNFWTA